MFSHGSFILSFKLSLSLGLRVIHFLKYFSDSKERKNGTKFFPLIICCLGSLKLFYTKGRQSLSAVYTGPPLGSIYQPWVHHTFGPGRVLGQHKRGYHTCANLIPVNWTLSPKSTVLMFLWASKSMFFGSGSCGGWTAQGIPADGKRLRPPSGCAAVVPASHVCPFHFGAPLPGTYIYQGQSPWISWLYLGDSISSCTGLHKMEVF